MSELLNKLYLNAKVAASPAAMDNVPAEAVVFAPPGGKKFLLGIRADYSAAVAGVKAVTVKKLAPFSDGVLNTSTLAIGTGPTTLSSTAFSYLIGTAAYSKAAVATGIALAAGTIPINKWGIYRVQIDAAGTISTLAGAANFTTGYDDEAAAIAALPAVAANNISMGYVAVLTAVGSAFVGGTDALQGGAGGNPSSDTNYYSTAALTTTTVATFRQTFAAGYADIAIPTTINGINGDSWVVELDASGAGSTTGRVHVFYV